MTYPTVGEKTIYRLFTISFLLLALVPTTTLHSQVYMKNLGTRGLELSMEMTATSDGNYVTVGPVTRLPNAPPGLDIYLNEVDPGGNLIRTRRIVESNGQGFGKAVPVSVTETFDSTGISSGFAVTGIVRNGISIDDPVMVVTTDNVGIPTGYNSYGGPLPINNVSDVIHTLNYLFGGGSPPSAPFDEPDPDPDNDQGNVFNMGERYQLIDQSLLAKGRVLAEE